MNFYKHHLGDFMRDTSHLSILEEGVYRRLIDQYYIRETPLPAEPRLLYKLARATSKDERQAVDDVAAEFFTKVDGLLHHKRCEQEIAAYQEKQEKAQKSAEARWQKQPATASLNDGKTASDGNANASADAMRTHMRTHNEGNASQNPESRIQNPEEPKTHTVDSSSGGATTAGLVCVAMRSAGIQRTNPSHPDLIALIKAGATIDEFKNAAIEAVERQKPSFAYALGVVKGQRRQALEVEKLTVKPIAARGKHADRKRTAEAFARRSKPDTADAIEGTFTRTD